MNDHDYPPNDESRFAPPEGSDNDALPEADEATPPDEYASLSLDNLAEEMAAFADEFNDAPPEPDTVDEFEDEPEPEREPEPSIRIAPADEAAHPEDEDIDVDLALAAVTGLDEMIEQREAEEQAVQEREYERERALAEEEARLNDLLDNPLPAPGTLTLGRGNLASLLPGLALVGVGVWLTFAYATESAPPPLVVFGVLVGVFGLALVSAWLGSGRWNRGALFFALWGALSAGGGWYAAQMGYPIAPVLIAALGAAFLFSAVLARPVSAVFAAPGLILLVVAGVMLAFSLNVIPPVVVGTLSAGWIVVAVICGLIVLLPLVRRLRG